MIVSSLCRAQLVQYLFEDNILGNRLKTSLGRIVNDLNKKVREGFCGS